MSMQRLYSSVAKAATLAKEKRNITANYRTLRSHYDAPKYPLVLCHGFSGFDKLTLLRKPQLLVKEAADQAQKAVVHSQKRPSRRQQNRSFLEVEYWNGIKGALEQLGSTVFIARVPAFGDIKSRAQSLDQYITAQCQILRDSESHAEVYNTTSTPDQEQRSRTFKQRCEPISINLISHSMGGLDCRYLISQIHNNTTSEIYKIASLTTISTPHHGSEVADFVVDIIKRVPILKHICPSSVNEMTTWKMREFNERIKDDPSVKYFSFGAKFVPKWFNNYFITWLIMKREIEKNATTSKGMSAAEVANSDLVDNDGLVSVESSKWGQYVGTLDQVDHTDLINWMNKVRLGFDKIMWARDPPFNAIALYLDIANELSHRGL
ncbi:uncharacterized protein LODBEIA_P28570 [Lodderomyces beijingensis]|uniref:DUF676 domain-containing protein n=1 Tax=Lodderomyces beijingensis TaxID=1775926 RepID=A0ABP0ZKF7_9ASCO